MERSIYNPSVAWGLWKSWREQTIIFSGAEEREERKYHWGLKGFGCSAPTNSLENPSPLLQMTAESWQIWWFTLAGSLHPLQLEAGPGISLEHEKFPGEFSALGSQVWGFATSTSPSQNAQRRATVCKKGWPNPSWIKGIFMFWSRDWGERFD